MTIPIEMFLVFMFSHLLFSFLDYASHESFSFATPSLFVIPDSIRNPVFSIWIPAGVYPVLRYGAGMTDLRSIDDHVRLGPQHAGESLNFGDDEITEDVDIRGLHQYNDIIRTSGRIGSLYPLDLSGLFSHIPGCSCRALDKDISRNRHTITSSKYKQYLKRLPISSPKLPYVSVFDFGQLFFIDVKAVLV